MAPSHPLNAAPLEAQSMASRSARSSPGAMLLMRLLHKTSILRRVSFGKPSRRMILFPARSIESN